MPGSQALISLFTSAVPLLAIVALAAYSIRILREYERGVVFQLGRFWRVKGPGLVIIIPFIQQMVRMLVRASLSLSRLPARRREVRSHAARQPGATSAHR